MIRILCLSIAMGLASASCAWKTLNVETPEKESLPPFNQIVLDVIRDYPTDGTHDYWWPKKGEPQYSGATEDLYFQGKRVMTGEPGRRTYCCGLTLEVFLRAYGRWLETRGGEEAAAFSADQWPRFQRLWFVQKLNGPGPSAALEAYNLGKEIPPSEALPGDFVQIWRTKDEKGKNSGHSVIFLNWARGKEGDIIGFRYWSTQPGTDGISERVEYFGLFGSMSTENTHFSRVEPKTKDEAAQAAGKQESGK